MKKETKKLLKEIKKLKKLVDYDELTEVLNRRAFKRDLYKIFNLIKLSKKNKNRKSIKINALSILFFDIDNFKKINDKYGHTTGDQALKFVVKNIKERIREIDLIGRYGGEEIVVGLTGAKKKDAFMIADYIREKIASTSFKFKNKKINITVSIGVAEMTNEKNIEELIDKADKAMYQAKKSGKNRVAVF